MNKHTRFFSYATPLRQLSLGGLVLRFCRIAIGILLVSPVAAGCVVAFLAISRDQTPLQQLLLIGLGLL